MFSFQRAKFRGRHGAPAAARRPAGISRLLTALLAVQLAGCQPPAPSIAQGPPEDGAQFPDCAAGSRPGPAGASDTLSTPEGVRYSLRAPLRYQPGHAHPLLVVYAPAGHSPRANEALTGLTSAATARGWLVAYAGAKPMALPTLRALAGLPRAIAARWCVDPTRIYATGHSDGGTISTALTMLPDLPHPFAAIVPSAAGFTAADLNAYACPAPRPVRVLHNAGDTHFPGYGREAADWWAQCNGCGPPGTPDAAGCLHYGQCPATGPVEYCEGPGDHRHWPAAPEALLDFLAAAPPRAP